MTKRARAPSRLPLTKKRKTSRGNKTLMGSKFSTKMKYVEQLQLNAGVAGVPATYIFSANGIYDPNITGVGHQPRGYDQISPLFNHHLVKASRIRVNFAPGASFGGAAICGITLIDDNSAAADMNAQIENRYTSWDSITPGTTCNRMLSFNSDKFFSIKDRDLYGTVGSNPVEGAFYVIWVQPTYSVDLAAIDVLVEIEYDVILTEPNNVSGS